MNIKSKQESKNNSLPKYEEIVWTENEALKKLKKIKLIRAQIRRLENFEEWKKIYFWLISKFRNLNKSNIINFNIIIN